MLWYLEQADPVVLVDADGLHGNGVHAVLLDPERVEGESGVGLVLADVVAVYLHLQFFGESGLDGGDALAGLRGYRWALQLPQIYLAHAMCCTGGGDRKSRRVCGQHFVPPIDPCFFVDSVLRHIYGAEAQFLLRCHGAITLGVSFTLRVRVRSSPFQKATCTSAMSWGLSNVNVISHWPPLGTISLAHDHLDSASSSPSWASSGRQPLSPQPTSPALSPGRSSKALAVTPTVVLVPASTKSASLSSSAGGEEAGRAVGLTAMGDKVGSFAGAGLAGAALGSGKGELTGGGVDGKGLAVGGTIGPGVPAGSGVW